MEPQPKSPENAPFAPSRGTCSGVQRVISPGDEQHELSVKETWLKVTQIKSPPNALLCTPIPNDIKLNIITSQYIKGVIPLRKYTGRFSIQACRVRAKPGRNRVESRRQLLGPITERGQSYWSFLFQKLQGGELTKRNRARLGFFLSRL